MQGSKASLWSALRSGAVLGGFLILAWQCAALRATVDEVGDLKVRLEAERGERAFLEAHSADLARRAEELERSIAAAEAAFSSSGETVGQSLRRLETRTELVESGLGGVRRDLDGVREAATRGAAEAGAIRRRLDAVAPTQYDALLAPTVKISSKSDVGSGTVVYCERRGQRYLSYVLTAQHIVEQNYDPKSPIPLEVMSFVEGKKVREESGIVACASAQLDLALIEIESERPYEATAKLLPRERIAGVPLYSRVHAIGCPLGYAPMPTSGELTSKSKTLDGQTYWMVNAPTIFGNSGGAIYLSDTHEMIGVLSRISAYKNLIDVAVPHMGIVTSMTDVYGWFEREHYQFLFDRRLTADACAKARRAEADRRAEMAVEVPGVVPAKTQASSRAE